jgi:RNA polymerase sigma factor (sigma-70 family)
MNDERLARRAAAGDSAAFEAIFRRYHQDLYRYCLATVGNPQDAQDALQSTMVKALQALPGEQREIKLKPWLYRVAHNEAVETLRRRRAGVELTPEREAANWEIAETATARERLRQLFADLEQLPERQRSTLVMRELAGFAFAEIGAALDTSPAVARQTLYEARLSLRQMDEGREMSCETVMRALSDADGRVTRRRDLRAHLRGCASCRAFRDDIAERRGELAAIAPLPAAFSAGLLQALTGGQAGTLGAGAVGAGLGKAVATGTIAKSAATMAVVAAVGVSVADRSGLVDLPLTDKDEKAAKDVSSPTSPASSGGSPPTPVAGPNGQVTGSPGVAGSGEEPGNTTNKGSSTIGSGSTRTAGQAEQTNGQGQTAPTTPAADNSKGGSNPQGGQQGASQGPPQAADQGQETAATHKPPQANPSPGADPRNGKAPSAPEPSQPSQGKGKGKGATPTPPGPPATTPETPEPPKGNSGSKGAGGGKPESTEP